MNSKKQVFTFDNARKNRCGLGKLFFQFEFDFSDIFEDLMELFMELLVRLSSFFLMIFLCV
jgi:hypothetical protein